MSLLSAEKKCAMIAVAYTISCIHLHQLLVPFPFWRPVVPLPLARKKNSLRILAHSHLARKQQVSGCPGMKVRTMKRAAAHESAENADNGSHLRQWPVQIRLAPVSAAFYQGADLLIAADCTAYAYGRFHQDFIRNRIVLIGCPKLDDTDYSLKLTDILAKNEIRSVTVVRMEVPCCGGISYAAEKAVARCGKKLPMQIITIGTDGEICR